MVVRPTGSGVGVTVVVVPPETGEVVVKGPAVVDPGTVALLVDELPLALPTRLPAPQGMVWPSGWVGFGGGVVEPEMEAMVKRVVHCLSGAPGAVNW